MLTRRPPLTALAASFVSLVMLTLTGPSAQASPPAGATSGSSRPAPVVDGNNVAVGGTVVNAQREESKAGGSSGSSKALSSVDAGGSAAVADPVYGYHGVGWVWVKEHVGDLIPECVVGAIYVCPGPQDVTALADEPPAATAPTEAQVRNMVTHVLVQLQVPRPVINLGPDPSVNEWNMAVVGYPLWLWTSEAPARSASITAYGYTFVLNARRDSVTFDLGDGTTLSCATTTAWPGSSAIGVPSPTCGHTYTTPSLPAGAYTITATAHWTVHWSALGYSGDIAMPLTTSRTVRVGELQSLRVA